MVFCSSVRFVHGCLVLLRRISTSFICSMSMANGAGLLIYPFRFLSFVQKVLGRRPRELSVRCVVSPITVRLEYRVDKCGSAGARAVGLGLGRY